MSAVFVSSAYVLDYMLFSKSLIMASERKVGGKWPSMEFWIVVITVTIISISRETYADNLGEWLLIFLFTNLHHFVALRYTLV